MATDPKAAVQAATTPTTFDFAAAIMDRDYPEFTVPVYINEKAAQKLIDLTRERYELEEVIGKKKTPPTELAERFNTLVEELDAIKEELRNGQYTFVVRGVAPEELDKLDEQSIEAFPREYTESINPITGTTQKTEVENTKRDRHLSMLIRQAHLVSITAPTGAVDTNFDDLGKVTTIFTRLPLLARAKVDESINACTIAVDYYREVVDEVF